MKAEDQSAEREAFEKWWADDAVLEAPQGPMWGAYKRHAFAGYIEGRRAALSAREAPAREGWQLVPKEPTPEMVRAIGNVVPQGPYDFAAIAVYRAMLAASPQAPTTEGSET